MAMVIIEQSCDVASHRLEQSSRRGKGGEGLPEELRGRDDLLRGVPREGRGLRVRPPSVSSTALGASGHEACRSTALHDLRNSDQLVRSLDEIRGEDTPVSTVRRLVGGRRPYRRFTDHIRHLTVSIGSNDTTGVEGPEFSGCGRNTTASLSRRRGPRPATSLEAPARRLWKPGRLRDFAHPREGIVERRQGGVARFIARSLVSTPALVTRTRHRTCSDMDRVQRQTVAMDAPLDIEAGLLRATDWTERLITPGAVTEATGLDYVGYLRASSN